MNNKFKDIDIKNHTPLLFQWYYQYKNFDPNKAKIDEKLHKNIFICYIGYVTIKNSKYIRINSVNPL